MPSFIGKMFGFGDTPKVSSQAATQAATKETEEAKRTAKTGRSALYETEGGVTGSELTDEQVKRRNTLLGN